MHYPKQVINSINYLNYFKSFIFKDENLEKEIKKKIQNLFNISKEIKFLGRARSGIFLAIKIILKNSVNNLVFLSPFTIPEVIDLVISAGGKPVFLKHDQNSTNLSIKELNKIIKKKPAALIMTHYHVNQKNYKLIHKICKKNKIVIVEDCAISCSGKSEGAYIGSLGDFSIYSFSAFKFINFFYGGAIAYKKKYKKIITETTVNWKKLSASQYFKKFIQTLKFDILTNQIIFNLITLKILKFLSQKQKFILNKKTYLDETFKLDKSYFSLLSNNGLKEIYYKTFSYKLNLNHRRFISKIYLNKLKHITTPKVTNSQKFLSDNEFMHYLIIAKSKKHRLKLKNKLLESGFDVGSFFYADCSKIKKFSKFGNNKSLQSLTDNLITLPTHKRITKEYAEKLSLKILELY